MSPTTPSGLPHRTISNIRSGAGQNYSATGHAGQASPHTPSRGASSSFGSPSSLRADEDMVVIELGTRFIRVGFAGDAAPKAALSSGPDQQRRAGDFKAWMVQPENDGSKWWPSGRDWARSHELWTPDLRAADLRLVGDKIERLLQEAFTKSVTSDIHSSPDSRSSLSADNPHRYLLIDTRPRRVSLVLPPAIPLPLLSTVLDTLFDRFQAPTVTLTSSAVMAAIGAGVRTAVVVNLGWAETVVSSVCEYREVRHTTSVRGAKLLVQEVHDMLIKERSLALRLEEAPAESRSFGLSFEECEELAWRATWCRQADGVPALAGHEGLPTVQEQDEMPADPHRESEPVAAPSPTSLTLTSCLPEVELEVAFDRLSDPCENTFIAPQYDRSSFDDEELPIPQLMFQHLLALPIDVRALCMSRIIFTGGCSNIPGLRQRLFDEVSMLVHNRGWDAVQGKNAEKVKNNARLKNRGTGGVGGGPVVAEGPSKPAAGDSGSVWHDAANATAEEDPVEKLLQPNNPAPEVVRGRMRAIESLGSWAGASLAAQLKTVAVASIDRELWMQQGLNGASRTSEVDVKAQQRQSLGPTGALVRGASTGTSTNWTLGAWGAL